jgi:hypothetical protein
MSKFSEEDRYRVRRSFSMSKKVKRMFPGAEKREELAMYLAPYYLEALFATPDQPLIVISASRRVIFHLYSKAHHPTKIRVVVEG